MLSFYYAEKARKEREVERLQECRSSLEGKQGEFNDNEPKCLEPELTLKTWHGNHASDFDDIRDAGIHTPYLEIAGEQFQKVYDKIADKIASLQAEIAELQRLIDQILASRS